MNVSGSRARAFGNRRTVTPRIRSAPSGYSLRQVAWSRAQVGGVPLRDLPGWDRGREPAIADEVLSNLMGDDVEARRTFIQQNARDVRFLDI